MFRGSLSFYQSRLLSTRYNLFRFPVTVYEEDDEDDDDDNDDDSGGGDVKEYIFCMFNPLSPKSDRHQISPYNINALENRVVMRIEYMIREDESS